MLRQFPDCSYVYAFFRARTLGYDVYPEDYFLRNFPWQQYGGLWVVDEARFARAEPINALTAQALRRTTGVGASTQTIDIGSPISYFTSSSSSHQPITPADPKSNKWSQPSVVPAFDGSGSGLRTGLDHGNIQPVLNMGGLSAALSRPELTLLTDLSRKYPGFPSPLSPTLSAKELYPTPTSIAGSRETLPQLQLRSTRSVSPMSVDGSNMCGPSTRCVSHGYEHYAEQMGLIDSVLAKDSSRCQVRSPPRAPSMTSAGAISPVSPQRAISPRAGMLRNMATKQALRGMHSPASAPTPRQDSVHGHDGSPLMLCSPRLCHNRATHPVFPSIQIANGTEIETGSPISPTGTMLSYTSNRAVESGLLAMPALSEPQVAEYRFWVPCGRRVCAFGCGGAHEGENAAAKRLFRGEESVVEQHVPDDDGYGFGEKEDSFEEVYTAAVREDDRQNSGTTAQDKSIRVEEWKRFLAWRDRDGSVARL